MYQRCVENLSGLTGAFVKPRGKLLCGVVAAIKLSYEYGSYLRALYQMEMRECPEKWDSLIFLFTFT